MLLHPIHMGLTYTLLFPPVPFLPRFSQSLLNSAGGLGKHCESSQSV